MSDYLADVEPAKPAVIEHYYDLARDLLPDAEPGWLRAAQIA